jgi:hypothetical protein
MALSVGIAEANTLSSDYAKSTFVIEQLIAKINTMTVVKVMACTNNGELSPVGFVDVKIMSHLVAGDESPIEHPTLYNIPYFRLQGGNNAIIIDPVAGDIGMCGFCNRDISEIKSKKDFASPASKRKHDYSDGLYFGGLLNGIPEQYIQFNAAGIMIKSPNSINLEAPNISISADSLSVSASTSYTGTITANGHIIDDRHTHENSGGTGTGGKVS